MVKNNLAFCRVGKRNHIIVSPPTVQDDPQIPYLEKLILMFLAKANWFGKS